MAERAYINIRWAYFGVVAAVSLIALAVVGISLVQDMLALLVPSLAESQIAREIASELYHQKMASASEDSVLLSEAEIRAYITVRVQPTLKDIIDNLLVVAIMGALFAYHFPRMMNHKE